MTSKPPSSDEPFWCAVAAAIGAGIVFYGTIAIVAMFIGGAP